MLFSATENNIINCLNYSHYIPVTVIAKQLYLSNKTIYRMIKKINALTIKNYDKKLVLSETGKGVKLNDAFIGESLNFLFEDSDRYYKEILELLFLFPHETDLDSLLNTYDMSFETVLRKLQCLQEYIEQYDLKIKRRQFQISIVGSETNVRNAIKDTIQILSWNVALDKMDLQICLDDKQFIESQIQNVEQTIGIPVTYPYDVNLFVHIFMILERYRAGKVEFLKEQPPLDNDEIHLLKENVLLYVLSKEIAKNIESYLGQSIHSLEVFFLFQNINALGSSLTYYQEGDEKLSEWITSDLITYYYGDIKEFGKDYYVDLYGSLKQHILPLINRIRSNIQIENNMLSDIKDTYYKSFVKIKKALKEILPTYLGEVDVSDNEVAFLVLYFEKQNLEMEKKLRILLVCSTGVGTSELLKLRLQKMYSNFQIVDTVNQRQLKRETKKYINKVDFIISTIHLDLDALDKQVINISPILSSRDLETIEYFMKECK